MKDADAPLVSIGIPVFNGEPYLREALQGICEQSYTRLEILIADNASTDRTEDLCRAVAERDSRVRYVRHESNRGAAYNYNFVADRSTGDYFKWAAADDVCLPNFVASCVAVLESAPAVVLAYPRTRIIDEQGTWLRDYDDQMHLVDSPVELRFGAVVRRLREANAVFGLMRRDALAETQRIGAYTSSDLVLLGELALRGQFVEVDAPLFWRRDHRGQSMRAHPDARDRDAWFDPSRSRRVTLPTWRVLLEYGRAIDRARLPDEQRRACRRQLVWWIRNQYQAMASEALRAGVDWTLGGVQRLFGAG